MLRLILLAIFLCRSSDAEQEQSTQVDEADVRQNQRYHRKRRRLGNPGSVFYSLQDEPMTLRMRECQSWYEREMAQLDEWLAQVNCEFACPLVRPDQLGCKTRNIFGICSASFVWSEDAGCQFDNKEDCSYHLGATGCARSTTRVSNGDAGQQCCYDDSGALIIDPKLGAGTVDRAWVGGSFPYTGALQHYIRDVLPYESCCGFFGADSIYCDQYFAVRPANTGIESDCLN